mgnify:CR=1 FL=1
MSKIGTPVGLSRLKNGSAAYLGTPLVLRPYGPARALLDSRYAAGEIDRDEYLWRRDSLDWGIRGGDYGP